MNRTLHKNQLTTFYPCTPNNIWQKQDDGNHNLTLREVAQMIQDDAAELLTARPKMVADLMKKIKA
jgi:hypothetical protein